MKKAQLIEQFRRTWRFVWVVHVPDLSSVVEANIHDHNSTMVSPAIQAAMSSEYKRGQSDLSVAVAGAFKMTHIATRYVPIYG